MKEKYNCTNLFFRICNIHFGNKEILYKFLDLVEYQKLDDNQINIFSKKIVELELKKAINNILKSINGEEYKNKIKPLKKLMKSSLTDEGKDQLIQKLPELLSILCKEPKENEKQENLKRKDPPSGIFYNVRKKNKKKIDGPENRWTQNRTLNG